MARLIPVLVALGVLVGCSVVTDASIEVASTAITRPTARPSSVPTPAPTPCFLGGGIADVSYGTLPEFARFADGVAIAEVVDVSPLRYSTEGGERPSCEYLEESGAIFGVGRMIELRVETVVAGSLVIGDPIRYWLGGGLIGEDESTSHHFGLESPEVGDRMVALVIHEGIDLDGGTGALDVNAYELFAIDADGRIITPKPDEFLTVETVKAAFEDQPPE
jgi:hypothetical protein